MKIYGIPDKVKGVIFDIDNTLYRNEDYVRDQRVRLLERFAQVKGMTCGQAEEIITGYIQKKTSMGNAFLAHGIPISESVKWREELCRPGKFLGPDKKLKEALEILAGHVTLLAVTNNPRLTGEKTLEVLGVKHLFRVISGLDDTGISKPAEEPFTVPVETAGLEHTQVLAVGDRYDVDLKIPLSLGMGAILAESMEDIYNIPAVLRLTGGTR
jgi:phosphoglycolate phosphatase/putative hydrolase of the HAD superfamily